MSRSIPILNKKIKKSKNSLLKIKDNYEIKVNVHRFTNYKQWDEMSDTNECMNLFKTWYSDHFKQYNHIKHAFNSLCKHYKSIVMKYETIKLDDNCEIKLAIFQSFNTKKWIYQNKEGNYVLIANMVNDAINIVDNELKSVEEFIKTKCA